MYRGEYSAYNLELCCFHKVEVIGSPSREEAGQVFSTRHGFPLVEWFLSLIIELLTIAKISVLQTEQVVSGSTYVYT